MWIVPSGLCKVRKYRFWKRISLFAIVFLIVWIYHDSQNLIFSASTLIADAHERCSNGFYEALLEDICENYTKGLLFGDMCNSLCYKKDIRISSCINHGTTVVLLGHWRTKPVVLKKKRGHSQNGLQSFVQGQLANGMALNSEKLQKGVHEAVLGELRSLLGFQSVDALSKERKEELVQLLLFGKDRGEVSKMTRQELVSHVAITAQDEFLMLTTFRKLDSFPTIIGTCGTLYAMEKLTPLDKVKTHSLPWSARSKIAQSFLKLVEALENTDMGALSHCDVQDANFGVSDSYEVKAIDVDLIFSEERIGEILYNPNCTSNKDCDFFDCLSLCDVSKKKCTDRKITNNFQVLCRDIFSPHEMRPGLLSGAPSPMNQRLDSLVKYCSSDFFGMFDVNSKRVQNTIKEMRTLLQLTTSSLHTDS